MAALKICQKVVGAGFEWPTVEGIWAKIREEEAELRRELERDPPTRRDRKPSWGICCLLWSIWAIGMGWMPRRP